MARLREAIPGRPGYWRGLIGVYGPKETKLRVFVDHDPRRGFHYRYKRPGESHCVYIGKVSDVKDVQRAIEVIELVSSIY